MIYIDNCLYVINTTRVNIPHTYNTCKSAPLSQFVDKANKLIMSVSLELVKLLADLAQDWHRADVLADTGVGRAIEKLLGVKMNSSKDPDYKGIELKSFRDGRPNVRKTLFSQVPNWGKSKCKSAREIVTKYGYIRDGKLTYRNTLSCLTVNSQNLGLSLYEIEQILAIEEKKANRNELGEALDFKISDVAVWDLETLHQRLRQKHHETFWIEIETQRDGNQELFRPTKIEHTKNPIVSQFDYLLGQGLITVDLLLARANGRGDTISFKLNRKAQNLLFPERELINLR